MDNFFNWLRPDTTPEEPRLTPEEKTLGISTELNLKISDDEFASIIQARIDESKAYYTSKLKLYERQKRNELFYLGQQINEAKLKPYQVGYVDNVIYEAIASIIPIAMSRLPDLVVKPGQDTPEQIQTAETLEKILNYDVRKRENRRALELALKHLFLFYFGCIKYRWDPNAGDDGDYIFEAIHPSNLVMDHTASEPNADKMQFIAQTVERSVKEMIADFPNKEADIYAELVGQNIMGESQLPTENILATKVKYTEIWFSWLEGKGEETERVEGVAWKFGKTLLKKMKNPNYDYEGEEVSPEGLDPQQAVLQAMLGQEVPMETKYYNFFKSPRKPYLLLTFDQLGKHWLDETTIIEQVIKLQQTINKRGIQISDQLDKARGKDVYNKSLFEKKDIEQASMYDSSTDLFADLPPNASITDAYVHIAGEMPSAASFQEAQLNRDRVFSKMGVNATTRGMVTPESTATEAQIARESDYGRIDYLVETTINSVAQQMSEAAMQMIKLRYTNQHMRRLLGEKGELVYLRISRDDINDGMEVEVGASGTDKTLRKQQALTLAKLGVIDPLTLYQELQIADAETKVKRLMTFQTNPMQYLAELEVGKPMEQMAQEMAQGVPPNVVAGQAPMPQEAPPQEMPSPDIMSQPTPQEAPPILQ